MIFKKPKLVVKPEQILHFKEKFITRAENYKNSVFLNPQLAPWNRKDHATAHSLLFRFLLNQKNIRYEIALSEVSPSEEWSRRSELIPANASVFSREKSIHGLNKGSKFLTICKDWAEEQNSCVVEIAACIICHHLYVSKKLGQDNHNTIDAMGDILVLVFLTLIFDKQYNDKWFKFDNWATHCCKSIGYAGKDEMLLDLQEFVYFFMKTFETLGFLKRINVDWSAWDKVEPGYNIDLQEISLFPSKHSVNSEWHNFDNIVLVRLINDPMLYSFQEVDFDSLNDEIFQLEFDKYASFCKFQIDWLEYKDFIHYLNDQQENGINKDTHQMLRDINTYLNSEYLLEQYLDYSILNMTYKTCNDGRAYLIDGIEYDNYLSNLVLKKGN